MNCVGKVSRFIYFVLPFFLASWTTGSSTLPLDSVLSVLPSCPCPCRSPSSSSSDEYPAPIRRPNMEDEEEVAPGADDAGQVGDDDDVNLCKEQQQRRRQRRGQERRKERKKERGEEREGGTAGFWSGWKGRKEGLPSFSSSYLDRLVGGGEGNFATTVLSCYQL